MESSESPRAIVAGHGTFPDGVVSAVDQITGKGCSLVTFSNIGLGRDEIESGMRRLLDEHGIAVIFTDLPGGSATLAARRIMHDIPTLTVVTGVNLTTLVDFVFCDGSMAPCDAARHAAEKGRASLTATGG